MSDDEQQVIEAGTRGVKDTISTGSPRWRAAVHRLNTEEEIGVPELVCLFGVTESAVTTWLRTGKLKGRQVPMPNLTNGSKKIWACQTSDVKKALGWKESE